ncbi:hypothetical protein [Streptomyces sp. V1I1]|uniref:hypothetical protein n=1 Tax=Streptomyces sp. V1I1 TaxID=3042272 RepID=UPI002784DF04|nr:hypothetical protein [Streptomyces sp. V1I1]MDQ0945485.1 hypothetical protein [Streptomyces sp. V1I1]
MNSTQQPTTPVVVTLSGCSKEDADTVFRVLGHSFASDRADDDAPQYTPHPHLSVWTATFDVAPTHAPDRPATDPDKPPRLSAALQVGIQGGYWAVDRTRDALAAAFEVTEEGMAAGDQEKDVQLRLESGGR